MSMQFRNVDAEPTDDVTSWPFEALVTAIDRGLISDWRPIFDEIRRSPWGSVTRRIERHVADRPIDGAGRLFELAIARSRSKVLSAERREVARRVRAAISESGLSAAAFAASIGTSGSRLSTYAGGTVMPSAAMLLRIERAARSDVDHASP